MNNKQRIGVGAAVLAGAALLAFVPKKTIAKGAVAVKPFDKNKYLGKWYEIARLDYFWEKHMNNVTATYSLNSNGTIRVDNRGYDYQAKEWKESIGKAKFAGKDTEAMLEVSFFGPFYAGYNVIALDPDYKYAMVAGHNLSYLWLLSRELTIPEAIKQKYLALAKSIGYKTENLVWTDHAGEQSVSGAGLKTA